MKIRIHVQTPQKQSGLSLIELMIALGLGLFLVNTIIDVYSGTRQTYRTQESLARLQENARFAIDTLRKDLRLAGFVGCKNLGEVTPRSSVNTVDSYSSSDVLRGFNDTGQETFSPSLPQNIGNLFDDTADADVLVIRGAGKCASRLNLDMADFENLEIDNNRCGFSEDDVVMLANCESADIFSIENEPILDRENPVAIEAEAPLLSNYLADSGAELLTLTSNVYYVASDPVTGIPALFSANEAQQTPVGELIAEGVESFQIEYGIDNDNDGLPDAYDTVPADLANVLVVKIRLLMRTMEDLGGQAFTHTIDGADIEFPEGPLRKEFVATVSLRNRNL